MKSSRHFAFALFSLLCNWFSSVEAQSLPFAKLYESEDKTGRFIDIFDSNDGFLLDVQDEIDRKGLNLTASLCANGVFLLYNDVYFEAYSAQNVRIFAGTEDSCVQPGTMKSVRFAQSYSDVLMPTLTIFTGVDFASYLDMTTITGYNTEVHDHGEVKSFILMGNSEWTVETGKNKFCLSGQNPGGDFQICPVADTHVLFQREENRVWSTVSKGCEPSTPKKSLNYCFSRGSGQLENVTSSEELPTEGLNPTSPEEVEVTANPSEGGSSNTTEVSSGTDSGAGNDTDTTTPETDLAAGNETTDPSTDLGPSTGECPYDEEFAVLVRLRLTHDFNNVYQIQFPLNKAHSWRTEILDNTIEIVGSCMNPELVSLQLLRTFREIYIYLAEKHVWTGGLGRPSKPRERVRLVGHETTRCLLNLEKSGFCDTTKQLSEFLLKFNVRALSKNIVSWEFRRIKQLDTTMEFMWLAINNVGLACSTVLNYETDFWMDYMNVAYDMYLQPMSPFWKQPGNFLSYYPIVLGGYDIEREYAGLAAMTTLVYKSSQLAKLPRPESVYTSDEYL